MWKYQQSTGDLYRSGILAGTGYSGHGEGKNNPAMQKVKCVGPVPVGMYVMTVITDGGGNPMDYEGKKAPVIRLGAFHEQETFGRDGFLIHGDAVRDPGDASEGCIVQDHDVRVAVATAIRHGDNTLQVVA